ncbi:MAG: nucleoside phosphorylase [Bacteroidales bacterium]|jgi:uridine phosphorylase|nr:nucleoside phosphorylase [Bacteroidales bacterium]
MGKIGDSELIINGDGSVFHLHIRPEELADHIILVGDPGRVDMISPYFDSVEFRRQSREFVTVTGSYRGKRITALSTGIGTDNIDIVMTELDALANVDFSTREVKEKKRSLTLLRVGTTGAIQPDIPLGAYVFSHYSIGCDGLLNWYADRNNISDRKMEEAFMNFTGWNSYLATPYIVKASEDLIRIFSDVAVKGVTISAPGFYGPQGRVIRLGLAMPDMLEKFEAFRYGEYKITNFEMEGSALAGLSRQLGHNAGTICCVIANRYYKGASPDYKKYMENMISMVLDKFATEA